MRNDLSGYEIILPGPSQQQMDAQVQARKQAAADAYKDVLQNEYDEFRAMRKYVAENCHKLRDRYVPIPVDGIQFNEAYECIIINDMQLVSFTEARDMIGAIEQKGSWKDCQHACNLLGVNGAIDEVIAKLTEREAFDVDAFVNTLKELKELLNG